MAARRGLASGCAAGAVIVVVAACGRGPTQSDPSEASARILGVTILASVNPDVPATSGQSLSGGVPIKIAFETDMPATSELKIFACLSEADSPMLNASCVNSSRAVTAWQSPQIMTTMANPGRTYRFMHVFLMRSADVIPGMGLLPAQYLDRRTDAILIFTVP